MMLLWRTAVAAACVALSTAGAVAGPALDAMTGRWTSQRVADICLDRVPAAVDRSQERKSSAIDTADGKRKTIVSFQKGSIAATGDAMTLEIATCNRVEGQGEVRCFPNRYVVRMSGQACNAQVTLARGKAGVTTCEHYAAQ